MQTSPWSEGDPAKAKLCLIGEAPARQEMRQGRPFVGPAGQVLNECLAAAGVLRQEVYITNVFKTPIASGTKHVKPNGWTSEEFQVARSDLLERLREVVAPILVPMGTVALRALSPQTAITKWRGSPISDWSVPGKFTIPTIHPAAVLRGAFIWRYLIIADLKKAKRFALSSEHRAPERTLFINPSFKEVMRFLHVPQPNIKQTVGIDIETSRHQVSSIAFAPRPNLAMCIPFIQLGGGLCWSVEEEQQLWHAIASILKNPAIEKIGQNFSFDMSFLLQQNKIHTVGPVQDTMIAHHILYPDFPKGLDLLTSLHTDEPYYKADGKIWNRLGELDQHGLDNFWQYNAKDAACTLEIWNIMEKELHEEGYWDQYRRTMDLLPVLMYMGLRGMKVDVAALEQTKKDIRAKIEDAEQRLIDASDHPFNPQSPKQCQQYFYEHKGYHKYTNRSTGKVTTDDKAMASIAKRYNDPVARIVQEIRSLRKFEGTYLEAGYDNDERLRCSYNPRGTRSGRLSSSQTIFGTGLNFQNLHPEFKHFLVAD